MILCLSGESVPGNKFIGLGGELQGKLSDMSSMLTENLANYVRFQGSEYAEQYTQ
jgi:hypothetical protein